jgi:NTP pyrophosphatase (non-canonical NTP hydrolase)
MSNVCPKCGTNEGFNCIDHDLSGVKTVEPIYNVDEFAQFTEQMWFSCKPGFQTERDLCIMSLGLAGESGEVVEHIKKLIRDGRIDVEELKKELGDVGYYWARICRYFGFWPSEVMGLNVSKLESRRARGTLRGDGDNR